MGVLSYEEDCAPLEPHAALHNGRNEEVRNGICRVSDIPRGVPLFDPYQAEDRMGSCTSKDTVSITS